MRGGLTGAGEWGRTGVLAIPPRLLIAKNNLPTSPVCPDTHVSPFLPPPSESLFMSSAIPTYGDREATRCQLHAATCQQHAATALAEGLPGFAAYWQAVARDAYALARYWAGIEADYPL